MPTKPSTIDFLCEQLAGAGTIAARKMFGEYGLYCDDVIFALVCNDELYVKPTTAGKEVAGNYLEGSPYPGAKLFLRIPADRWDEREWLIQVVRATLAELALPKPKKPRKAKK